MLDNYLFLYLLFGLFGLLSGLVSNYFIDYLPRHIIKQHWQAVRQVIYEDLDHHAEIKQLSTQLAKTEQQPTIKSLIFKPQSVFVNILSCLMAVLLVQNYGLSPELLIYWLFGYLALMLACIDFNTRLLPDVLVYSLLWTGLVLHAYDFLPGNLTDAVFGALTGYIALWALRQIYLIIRQEEYLGLGDAKLLAAIGAWFGWQALPKILLITALSGLIYAVLRKCIKPETSPYIALGPFMLLGATWHFLVG